MSKEESDTHLRYGQGILLEGFKGQGDDGGLLTTKGFADATAKYETYSKILYFKNYRNAIFQILPASNFEINDELRETLELSTELTPYVKILKARAESEVHQFRLNSTNKLKQQIFFGDYVVLQHVDSDTYLSGTIRPSNGKNGAFTVQVTKDLSEKLIFQVLPFRSFQKLSMPIPFDSPVKFRNIVNDGYLTFQKLGIEKPERIYDPESKLIQADNSYIIPVKTNSLESEIYECVTHFVDLSVLSHQPMPWRFKLHMQDVINDSLIQHDIIFFQHTQNNGVLSTEGKEIILKELKKPATQELQFYECLWEIEKHEEENQYILRHLMSGMTLGIAEKDDVIWPQLVDITDTESKLGVIELKLAKMEGGDIQSGSLINICWKQKCLDKCQTNQTKDWESYDYEHKEYFPINELQKRAVHQLNYMVKSLGFTSEISKNCFIIKEIKDDLKKQVLFALSFHSKIIDLRQDLKYDFKQSEQKIGYIRMMQMTEKIKEIKHFLKDCSREQSNLEYIKPIFKRQMICKDLGISELLFELLFYMRKNLEGIFKPPNEYIFHQHPNQLHKFLELYNSIYEVIYELVKGNRLFKVHVAKWINFVFEDVIVLNEPSHLELLKEILRDNNFLINNFVDARLVEKLVSRMLTAQKNFLFYERKYLEIFRLFCVVGNEINITNQIYVLKHFVQILRTQQNAQLYQITLSKEGNEIFTEAAIDKQVLKKRKFDDYYKICKEEHESAWLYFVEYLSLIGDMTRGRNKTVESYLESMFTLDILGDLFEKQELHEAEVPIIRILRNLNAQNQRYYPIERDNRIVNFNTLPIKPIDIMTTTSEVKPLRSSLKRILDRLRTKLSTYGPIDPAKVHQNQILEELLIFVWQTLDLGFWDSRSDIQAILNMILAVLRPHEQIDYTLAKVESKQNSLMVRCKLIGVQIIQQILDYQVDLSVSHICKYFCESIDRLLATSSLESLPVEFIKGMPNVDYMVETSLMTTMIELSRYSNPRLTSQSISIIERILLMKRKIVESFEKVIFVCEDETVQLVNFIEARKHKFSVLLNSTLVSVTAADQDSNYVAINREDKDSGIMQDMYMMSELIKYENSITRIMEIKTLEGSKMSQDLGTGKLINFTSQRSCNQIMKQHILAGQNLHLNVLQYALHYQNIPQDLPRKLLHLSYKFLVSLIWNNPSIKRKIVEYIPLVSHQIRANVGCIDFLKEMYDNNKTLLFNEAEIVKLVKDICFVIEAEPASSNYKAKLLDFFRFLIYCNCKCLKYNQIRILKIMQDDSYKTIIIPISTQYITKLVQEYITTFKAEKQTPNIIKVQPQLLYLISYFQLLSNLIDGDNVVNMGKLKKRFPFQVLVKWIRKSLTCWPLKRNLRAFLNRLYYFQPEIQTQMKTIIDAELANIIEDLNYYIEIKCRSSVVEHANYIFQNPVRFSYLQSYLYLNLEENLFTLYQLTTRQKIDSEVKNILRRRNGKETTVAPNNFIRICERLGFIKNYFSNLNNQYTTEFIEFLLGKFKVIISAFDDSVYSQGMMHMNSAHARAPTKDEKENAREALINKIMQGEIGSFFVHGEGGHFEDTMPLVYRLPEKLITPKEEEKKSVRRSRMTENLKQASKDEEINDKMTSLVTAIKQSREADTFLFQDYNLRLAEHSGDEQIFDYITVIIRINSESPSALQTSQKFFFLNMITGIVQQTSPNDTRAIDEWETEDWADNRQVICNIQSRLKECRLGLFLTELLKQNICDHVEFADAILLCGISYLFGGNSSTQKDLIDAIGSDNKNKVMSNIEELISKLGKFILKNIEESQREGEKKKNAFVPVTIDNYDFYNAKLNYVTRMNVLETETTDEKLYFNYCVSTYRRAFKLLQLLCENNNEEGKRFIREQPNGIKKFNFINIAAKELRSLFISLNSNICNVVMFLLDFLLEVTQIPMKQNQEALMDLTFFEDLCQMAGQFEKQQHKSIRGFGSDEEPLRNIYFKSIQIILSTFEGNDEKTFRLLDNKLQPKFLVTILRNLLKSMNIQTSEDAIAYVQREEEGFTFKPDMMAVLNILTIFLKLKEIIGEKSRMYENYLKIKADEEDLFRFFEECLLSIEINDFNNHKQTVMFPKHPVFNLLFRSANLKDSVMNLVTRTTHRQKIVSLLGYVSAIKQKIQESYQLLKKEKISQASMNSAFNASVLMSVIVCIFMAMFYDVILQHGQANYTAPKIISLTRFALSLIQLSMSLAYGYYWYKFRMWQQPKRHSRQTQPTFVDEEAEGEKLIKWSPVWLSTAVKTIFSSNQVRSEKNINAQPIWKSAQFYRVALYIGVAWVGTFIHPIIFFLHIIDIICYIPELGNIFRAVARKIVELVYISLMGVAFTIIFCTVTFSNYMKNVYPESGGNTCDNIPDCISQLFVAGVIGETMEEFQLTRFIYDLIYAAFFGLLFNNIVSGFMLSSFEELRKILNDLKQDKKNCCYICEMSRETIEKEGKYFDEHVLEKHYLWNYVCYIYALEKKSPTDYSGLQYYISTRYNRSDEEMDISWIPSDSPEKIDTVKHIKHLIQHISHASDTLKANNLQLAANIKEINKSIRE